MERVWRIALLFLIFGIIFDPLMTIWGIGRLGVEFETNETVQTLSALYGVPAALVLHTLPTFAIILGMCLLTRFLFTKAHGKRVGILLGSFLASQWGVAKILAGLSWEEELNILVAALFYHHIYLLAWTILLYAVFLAYSFSSILIRRLFGTKQENL